MSLDILKERFSGKPITSEYEEKLENKEQTIQKLNEETILLSDEVNKLKTSLDKLCVSSFNCSMIFSLFSISSSY